MSPRHGQRAARPEVPSWLLVVAVLQGFSLIAAVVGVGWLVAHVGLFGPAEQKMLGTLTFRVVEPAR